MPKMSDSYRPPQGDAGTHRDAIWRALDELADRVAGLDPSEASSYTDEAAELANEHGIDLADVNGTGEQGRVLKGDVEDWLEGQADGEEDPQQEEPEGGS